MESIKIAGVNCRVDLLGTIPYEDLLNSALGSIENKGKSKEEIVRILEQHGFKPSKIDSGAIKPDKRSIRRESSKGRNTRKRSGNRGTRKGKMEKGS